MQEGTRVYVPIDIVSRDLGDRMISVDFLIDTGADRTTISPLAAIKNRIDFSKLRRSKTPSVGIGGEASREYIIKKPVLQLAGTDGELVWMELDEIDVMKAEENTPSDADIFIIPSLLGTDLLKKLKLTYNAHAKLELKEK